MLVEGFIATLVNVLCRHAIRLAVLDALVPRQMIFPEEGLRGRMYGEDV